MQTPVKENFEGVWGKSRQWEKIVGFGAITFQWPHFYIFIYLYFCYHFFLPDQLHHGSIDSFSICVSVVAVQQYWNIDMQSGENNVSAVSSYQEPDGKPSCYWIYSCRRLYGVLFLSSFILSALSLSFYRKTSHVLEQRQSRSRAGFLLHQIPNGAD